jgi:hypothetical protein
MSKPMAAITGPPTHSILLLLLPISLSTRHTQLANGLIKKSKPRPDAIEHFSAAEDPPPASAAARFSAPWAGDPSAPGDWFVLLL